MDKFVFSGVLQGSVMRANIFLLFIKDLPETLTNNIKIFADDVNLKSLCSTFHWKRSDIFVFFGMEVAAEI